MLEDLESKINKNLITSKQLTSNLKFIDNKSKKTIKYNDNLYIPFFYCLGKIISPDKVFEIGINLAFLSSAFFKSCKQTNYYLGFQQKSFEFFNKNIAQSNLTINYKNKYDIYCGNFNDDSFLLLLNNSFDLVVINQDYKYDYLFEITENIYLNKLNKEGMMIFSDLTKKNASDIFMNISKGYKVKNKVFKDKIGVIIK